MNYGQMRAFDIANGEGIRTTLFVTGCTHACPDCFNREYMDFRAGRPFGPKEEETLLRYLAVPEVDGLTILGGEPFQNIEGLLLLLLRVRRESKKSIWIYSGYTYEEILSDPKKRELLALTDVLVDGRFEREKKDLTLRFRGSSNQRIIDVKKSLQDKTVRIYME